MKARYRQAYARNVGNVKHRHRGSHAPMLGLVSKLRRLLTGRDKKRFFVLLVAVFAMGFFEVAGIAAVVPFMHIVAHPDSVQQNAWLRRVYEISGLSNTGDFVFFLGAVVLGLIAITNAVAAFTKWLQSRFVWGAGHSLAVRLLSTYVYQPYEFFLSNSTSTLGKQVLSEVNQLVRMFLLPFSELVAQSFVSLVIFALLLAVNPQLGLTVILTLGGLFLLVYLRTRNVLLRTGRVRVEADRARFKTANETLWGIKSTKIRGSEAYFIQRFDHASRRFANVQARFEILAQTPRYLVEFVAFGGLLIIILHLLATRGDLQDVIPTMTLYAFAGYRLLPSIQNVFKGISSIRFNGPALDAVLLDLEKSSTIQRHDPVAVKDRIPFTEGIRVAHMSFRYPGERALTLAGIDLDIPKGSSVAFVGATGSGKTTLVDIITGLLRPSSGSILIDGVPVSADNVRRWQATIGYVPQEVQLNDDTVTHNIAYGVVDTEIDMARVQQVATMANIHKDIAELPQGYETMVGERGIRFSGGQRQRLGLARALYHDPEVLVLDEATSSLDGITEEAVMDAIRGIGHAMTIIIIAHRLATVEHCDVVYMVHEGRITATGTFQELIQSNSMFRGMAKLTS